MFIFRHVNSLFSGLARCSCIHLRDGHEPWRLSSAECCLVQRQMRRRSTRRRSHGSQLFQPAQLAAHCADARSRFLPCLTHKQVVAEATTEIAVTDRQVDYRQLVPPPAARRNETNTTIGTTSIFGTIYK